MMKCCFLQALLFFTIIMTIMQTIAAQVPENECEAYLEGADHDRDNRLSRGEFTSVVYHFSHGTIQANNFMELPDSLQDTFTRLSCRCLRESSLDISVSCCGGEFATVDITGIFPGSHRTQEQSSSISETCMTINKAIPANIPMGNRKYPDTFSNSFDIMLRQGDSRPMPSLQQCLIAIIIVDQSPTNSLLNNEEYTHFINRVSGNIFPEAFDALPSVLKENFNTLAIDNGQINVYGARPGVDPGDKQSKFLEKICENSGIAINSALDDGTPPTSKPIASPPSNVSPSVSPPTATLPTGSLPSLPSPVTSAPTDKSQIIPIQVKPSSATSRPTRPLNQCYVGLIISDNPRDYKLDSAQYTSFVKFMEPNAFDSMTFRDLPKELQSNFESLSVDGSISIQGLPIPSDEQAIFLRDVCHKTNIAISVSLKPEPSGSPLDLGTTSPSIRPETDAPTKTPSKTPKSPNPTKEPTQVETPKPTPPTSTPFPTPRPTFAPKTSSPSLREENTVSPTKSPSNSPSVESIRPTNVESKAPSSLQPNSSSNAPSKKMRKIEVSNQFVVSNKKGITIDQISDPENSERHIFDRAYSSFVKETIADSLKVSRRFLRARRALLVEFMSIEFISFNNTNCPDTASPDAICFNVSATFSLTSSINEDSTFVQGEAKQSVDVNIFGGRLQEYLNDRDSSLIVEIGGNLSIAPSSSAPLEGSSSPSVPSALTNSPSSSPPSTVPPSKSSPIESLSLPPTIPIESGNFTGNLTIESSFIISNTINLVAAGLKPGSADRIILEDAYNATALDVLKEINDNRISFFLDSAVIMDIVDVDCPESTGKGAVCQAAFAEFKVVVNDVNQEATQNLLTDATQNAIKNRYLQQSLDEMDINGPISIEEGSPANRPPSSMPSPAPSPASSSNGVDKNGTSRTILIVASAGGSVLLIVLIAVCCYCCRNSRSKRGEKVSAGHGFGDGLIEQEDSNHGFNEIKKGRVKIESSDNYDKYGKFDDSEYSTPSAVIKAGVDRKEFLNSSFPENSDRSSDSYVTSSDSEEASLDSKSGNGKGKQRGKSSHDSFASSDIDNYEFDDPSVVKEQKGRLKSGQAGFQPSSDEDSESESDSISSPESKSASNSDSESIYDSESSEENDDGWDDEDGSVSQSDKAEESEGNTSFTDLAASRTGEKPAKVREEDVSPLVSSQNVVTESPMAVKTKNSESLNTRSENVESNAPVSDSETDYTSDDQSGLDGNIISNEKRDNSQKNNSVAVEATDDSNSESGSQSHASSSRSSRSYSESDADSVPNPQHKEDRSSSRSASPLSPVPLDDESESSYSSKSYSESEGGLSDNRKKSENIADAEVVGTLKSEKFKNEREHRSALDDSESEIDESDYTDSDDGTYEEGTLDGDGTLATYEDSAPRAPDGRRLPGDEEGMPAKDSIKPGDSDITLTKGQDGIPVEVQRNSDFMDTMVKKGDWDGIINHAGKVEKNLEKLQKIDAEDDDESVASSGSYSGSQSRSESESRSHSRSSYSGSSYSQSPSGSRSGSRSRRYSDSESGSDSRSEGSYSDGRSDSEEYTTEGASSAVETYITETPAEIQRKQEVRAEVEALVRLVVPEEVDNIDAMLAQFKGREEELLQTLRTMQERSVTVRARAAVHKSSGRPTPRRPDGIGYRRDGAYSVDSRQTGESETSRGSAAGSAIIAAASIARPATGRVPIHAPPVPAYESRNESEGSSPYSDPSKNSSSRKLGANVRSKSPSSDSESESHSGSESHSDESGSYSSGSYTSASGSRSDSGSYSGSNHNGSDSYTSETSREKHQKWIAEKKQPWNKQADDLSYETENDRHQALSTGKLR
jgi:hypothetical protein